MPRAIRTHAPNKGLHITARLQNGADLFNESMRDDVANFICEAVVSGGARALALTVMPSHFHLVIKQGRLPLGWMMQRAMQRTAHLVQRFHDVEGHVFGRRYWSSVCSGPDYLRNAIVYAHLNAPDARLCRDAREYAWCSHALMVDEPLGAPWEEQIALEEARLLFAHDSLKPHAIIRNYLKFVNYCLARRREGMPGDWFLLHPMDMKDLAAPRADLGDKHWAETYSHAAPVERPLIETVDVRDRAITILRRLDPACTIDMIRSAGRTKQLCRLRREVIAALLNYRYTNAAIARCLRVSQSVVSDVVKRRQRPSTTS